MNLRKQIGQLMIVGVEGTELSALEASWLRMLGAGGVILFRRNIETAEQTYRLLAELNKLASAPLFRCVDVEGGLVDRLRDLIAPMPSAAAVAASLKPANYRKHGQLVGREVSALGFNAVFAPVLDLALSESRPVMRTRTASVDADEVTAYASGFLGGLKREGVLGCGKHFPGLGAGTLDSHHATPIIERTWDQLWHNDLMPYRKLSASLPMVMVSHASYPAALDDPQSASISNKWITEILVKKIKYRGLIVSDDMEMGGILIHTSIEEAAVQAIAAGTHTIEICRDPALVLRAYEALLSEAETSPSFRSIVGSAIRKILRVKRALRAFPGKAPSRLRIHGLRDEIQAFSARVPEPEPANASS